MAKVSDFGLIKVVHEKDYYQEEESISLPIRWMSMESMQCCVFTTQTDVVCMRQYTIWYTCLEVKVKVTNFTYRL